MLDRRDELEAFKGQINLTEYAAASGYSLDRKASSRSSAVMRHTDGDKIVIARDGDAHWIYFSVRDDQDSGSIIDFVQRRKGMNLGEVRKELRPWIGRPPSLTPTWCPLVPASKDLLRIHARVAGMFPVTSHPYLENERALPLGVLSHARFSGTICQDDRGNVVFPHRKNGLVCGGEVKNRGFTGFLSGGSKALWMSNDFDGDNALVITEAAIDGLSHYAIKRLAAARYASIAGAMNKDQPSLLRAAVEKLPSGSRVIIATDNDPAGEALASAISGVLTSLAVSIVEDRPPTRGLDWNDVLRSHHTF